MDDAACQPTKTYDAATHEELVADGGVKTAYTIVKSEDKTNSETGATEASLTDTTQGNNSTPKTGDHNLAVGIYTALAVLSAGSIIIIAAGRNKKNKKERS
jgi:hypothetical protein